MKKRFYQNTALVLSTVLMLSVGGTNVFAEEQTSEEPNFDYVYVEDQCAAVAGNQNILIQVKEGAELPTSASLQYHTKANTKKETIEASKISGRTLVFSLPCGTEETVVSLDQIECKTKRGTYTIRFTEEKTTYQVSKKNETDDAVIYLADGKSVTTSPIKITAGQNIEETALSVQKAIENIQNDNKKEEHQKTEDTTTVEDKAARKGGELFRDVKKENWFYPSVSYVMNKGLMSGLADGNFGVSETINRAQLATILYRMEGSPAVNVTSTYADVPSNAFYTKAILWAVQEGLLFKQNTNSIQPLEKITKEELIFTLCRYAEKKGFYTPTEQMETIGFTDANKITASAKDAIAWASFVGLIHGDENNLLRPQEKTSRAVCASILTRFCEMYLPNKYPNIPIYAKAEQIALTANDKKTGSFTISVSDMQASTDVTMAEVAVWSAADGSDKHTYLAKKQNNQFTIQGTIQNHQLHTGTYHITVYAILSNGIRVNAGTKTVTIEGDEAQSRIQKHVNAVYAQTGKDLYACYQWVVQNMKYKKMPILTQPPAGYTSEQWNAVVAFEQRQGNCFNYAAAFCELAKGLGYDARYVEGSVPLAAGGRGPHGWVEITKDGAVYICDPDLQYEIKNRNFYMQPVGRTVIKYYR